MATEDGETVTDVVMTERAAHLRRHPGQMSFPGGRLEPTDADPGAAALREAWEETALDPRRVELLGALPPTHLSRAFATTVVLGLWAGDQQLEPDPDEVASVQRVRLADVVDPSIRCSAEHPRGGRGPAFELGELFLWGFTAHVVDRLLELAGWAVPWDRERLVPIPERFLGA